MHEVSWRWTLTMSVIAAVEGVVALVLGAFVAPIAPQGEAIQIATAVFIRGILALISLAVACVLGYMAGYRIEAALGPSNADPSPAVATSPLISLFVTPGPRRDALYAGAITLSVFWLFTTIYIAALGHSLGNISVSAGGFGSFALTRLGLGLALALAGAGAGALGARNAATRRVTRRIFETAPVAEAAAAQLPRTQPAPPAPPAPLPQHVAADTPENDARAETE